MRPHPSYFVAAIVSLTTNSVLWLGAGDIEDPVRGVQFPLRWYSDGAFAWRLFEPVT
jgi:hypothetical protein